MRNQVRNTRVKKIFASTALGSPMETNVVLHAQKFLALIALGALLSFSYIAAAAPANAVGCQSGGSPWGGGGFCDSDYWKDGSYMHCVDVYVLGFGGGSCGRVCPPPPGAPAPPATDLDPRTRC